MPGVTAYSHRNEGRCCTACGFIPRSYCAIAHYDVCCYCYHSPSSLPGHPLRDEGEEPLTAASDRRFLAAKTRRRDARRKLIESASIVVGPSSRPYGGGGRFGVTSNGRNRNRNRGVARRRHAPATPGRYTRIPTPTRRKAGFDVVSRTSRTFRGGGPPASASGPRRVRTHGDFRCGARWAPERARSSARAVRRMRTPGRTPRRIRSRGSTRSSVRALETRSHRTRLSSAAERGTRLKTPAAFTR